MGAMSNVFANKPRLALIVCGLAVISILVYASVGITRDVDSRETRDDISVLQYEVANMEENIVATVAPTRGERGMRGPRGYKGDKGAKGQCVALNQTTGDEIAFECPDAADSETVKQLEYTVSSMARLLIMTQVQNAQRVRTEGGSGIVASRGYSGGSAAYHESSYTNFGVANFHDHANNRLTVGMGEVAVVLNGVTFVTRHNDYPLKMPHRTFQDYHATEDIILPQVPDAVLTAGSVPNQIEEMRAWFKAFNDQDYSVRDYRPFFTPVLTIMEGAWIYDSDVLEEPFESDRHFVDAKSWNDLHDKTRFLFESGRKNMEENLPFLPTSIRDMGGDNNTIPVFANFEYRIVACPLTVDGDPTSAPLDIPTNRFRVVHDLHPQMYSTPTTLKDMYYSRRALFQVNPKDQDDWHYGRVNGPQLLDKWMGQVPGKNNYAGVFRDAAYGYEAANYEDGTPLNSNFYSRYYAVSGNDAMGRNQQRRSFSDPNMWAAMTDHEKVSGLTVVTEQGDYDPDCAAANPSLADRLRNCPREETTLSEKWTWAIPIEVIYLTPLTRWNPYNLKDWREGRASAEERAGYNSVDADGRNGDATDPAKAYNGIHRRLFYMTPAEFFAGGAAEPDAADTAQDSVGVLDQSGVLRQTRASGHWVIFPKIADGTPEGMRIRQRFPIMPVHYLPTNIWKEVKALQDVLMAPPGSSFGRNIRDEVIGINLELTFVNGHTHTLYIDGEGIDTLSTGAEITVTSTTDNGHSHAVTFTQPNSRQENYEIVSMTGPEENHLLRKTIV